MVEGGGEGIGPGVATGGVGAPAGGVVPAVAVAGGVGMDGDDDDVVLAEPAAPGIDAAAAQWVRERTVKSASVSGRSSPSGMKGSGKMGI